MATATNKTLARQLQSNSIRLGRIHFGLVAAYAGLIIASDSWNLVTRQLTSQRWLMFGMLLIVTTVSWYLSRAADRSTLYYRTLMVLIILADVALATFAIYTERGMSSRGVALYFIPIVSSSLLLRRSAIFGTAALATASYVMAATRYFYVYFNEGYRIELYSTLGFYSACFFVVAAVLWVLTSEKDGSSA